MVDKTEEGPKRTHGVVLMMDALGVRSYDMLESQEFVKKSRSLISQSTTLANLARKEADPEFPQFSHFTFGDTIIITWECAINKIRLNWVCAFASHFFKASLTKKNIPLRGALSYGGFVKAGQVLLGPAVADAAVQYERADWLGFVCTLKFALEVKCAYEDENDAAKWGYLKYDVPLRGGGKDRLLTVAWPSYDDEGEIVKYISQLEYPPDTEAKYRKTIDYFEFWHKNH